MAAILPVGQSSGESLAFCRSALVVIPRPFRHAAFLAMIRGYLGLLRLPHGERTTAVLGTHSRVRGDSGEAVKGATGQLPRADRRQMLTSCPFHRTDRIGSQVSAGSPDRHQVPSPHS